MRGPERTEPRPPGWYADPALPGSVRWFDGRTWSEHRRPDPRPARLAPPAAATVRGERNATWTPSPRALVVLAIAISVLGASVVSAVTDHSGARESSAAAPRAAAVTPLRTPATRQLVVDTGWTCANAAKAARDATATEMSSQRVVRFDDVALDVDHQGTWATVDDGGVLPVLRCTATGTFATHAVAPVAVEITYAGTVFQVQVLVDDGGVAASSSRIHPLPED